MWQFHEKKNGWFLFISLFVKGAFYIYVYGDCINDIIEDAIDLILYHYKAHFHL